MCFKTLFAGTFFMLMLLDDRDSPLPLFFNLFFQGMCWGFFSPTWPQRPPSSPSFLRRLRFVGPSLYLLHRSYPCVQTTGFFYIGICGQIVFLRSRERGSPWPCCSCQTAFRTWRWKKETESAVTSSFSGESTRRMRWKKS